MRKLYVLFGIIILAVVCLMLFLQNQGLSEKRPIQVVTTIGQIHDIVVNIAGDLVEVHGLMGAGVDPHLYKASESDVRTLAEADIILYNGLFLEAKLEKILHKMGRNKIVEPLAEAIPLDQRLESVSYTGHYDPHVWFDIPLWKLAILKARDILMKNDPEHASIYHSRTEEYLKEVDSLHNYVLKKSSQLSKSKRILITAHDAFRYFGRKYGFEVVGLQGISTDSQAGTADVIRLADFIVERKISAIYIESSVPERNVQAVVEAVRSRGWDVKVGGELFSDAMGDAGTFEGTYIGMVTHNINTIVEGLKE